MRKILILLTVTVLILALTACGEKTEVSEQESEISVILSSEPERSIKEPSEESDIPLILESNTPEISMIEFSNDIEYIKPYRTLQECIDHSENIKAMIESLSNEEDANTENQVIIENDTRLVFERTLKENITYSDTFAADTEKALNEKRDEFVEIVNLFEWGIDNDNITVVVRYRDTEGNVIFEKEFDNEE